MLPPVSSEIGWRWAVTIDNARFVAPADVRHLLATVLAPLLAARRLDIALLKDLLMPSASTSDELLLLPHGAVLPGLDFDADGTTFARRRVNGIVAAGDLTVDGDILSDAPDSGPFLIVLGKLQARRIVQSGLTLVAAGQVTVTEQTSCDLSRGSLRAYGGLRTRELVIGDERLDVAGTQDALRLVLMDVVAAEMLLPDLFYDEACNAASAGGELGRTLRDQMMSTVTVRRAGKTVVTGG